MKRFLLAFLAGVMAGLPSIQAQTQIPGNCLFIAMFDTFGDGWNGATFTVTDSHGDVVATGGLGTGTYGEQEFCLFDGCYTVQVTAGAFPSEIYWSISDVNEGFVEGTAPSTAQFSVGALNPGCTDPTACNYEVNASTGAPLYNCDNGTCCYSHCYELVMYDSFGDGWNGGSLTLQDINGFVGSYTLDDGFQQTVPLCLIDGCYTATVTGGSFPSEIFWQIRENGTGFGGFPGLPGGENIVGGAPDIVNFTIGNAIDGCTSPSAVNYESYATCDDGSCEFCDPTMALELWDTGGDGWEGAVLSIYETGNNLIGQYTLKYGSYRIIQLCLPFTCNTYSMFIEGAENPEEISYTVTHYNDGISYAGTAGEMLVVYADEIIYGCTDPSASNYDPDANCPTCGGCLYESCVGDFDNSGAINLSDLLVFLSVFGTTCE